MLLWLAEGTHGLQRLRRIGAPAAGSVRSLALCCASGLLLVAHAGGELAVWPFAGRDGTAAAGQAAPQAHVMLKVSTATSSPHVQIQCAGRVILVARPMVVTT